MRVSGHAQGTIASSPNLRDSLEVGWPFDISSWWALASSFPFWNVSVAPVIPTPSPLCWDIFLCGHVGL